MLNDIMESHQEAESYRGFRIMLAITERPTTWHIDIRIGTWNGDSFTEKLPHIIRDFGKPDGAVNCGLYMVSETKAAIDQALEAVPA